MTQRQLAGAAMLVRLALRRDRLLLAVWVPASAATVYASAAATASLYPSLADRVEAARAINANAVVVALYGPILDERNLGELAMTKLTVLYAVGVALLCLMTVRRHTRAEEESGRAELVGGTAIGRAAPLTAAVLEGVLVAVGVGIAAATADVAGGLPWAGSLAFAASWVGIGLVAVGVMAVACQLSASSRTCAGLAGVVLAWCYAVRAVGDVGPGWLSWLSPFGWSTRLSAWSHPRWWVLGLYVVLAAASVVAAHRLASRRDLGSGVISERSGPARGSPWLSSAITLAWRLNRTTLVAWTVGAVAFGAVFGAVAPDIAGLLDSDAARAMIESLGGVGALQDTLLAAVLALDAVAVTCFGLTVVVRSAADERAGLTEQVLATGASRGRVLAATVAVAAGGMVWLMAVTGVTTGLALGADRGLLLGAALAQVPATWVVVGIGLLLHAVSSGWSAVGWVVLGGFVLIGELGDLLGLPGWLRWLSPYAHSPAMPGESFRAGSSIALTLLAAALVLAARWRFQRRDIT